MKRKYSIIIGLISTTFAGSVYAENSDFRKELRERSQSEAIGGRSVVRYAFTKGKARPNLATELRRDMVSQGLAANDASVSSAWEFSLSADGTAGSIRRRASGPSRANRWSLSHRPTLDDLETDARNAALGILGNVLRLTDKEELLPWKVEHRVRSGGAAGGSEVTEELAGSAVVFTRVIDGVPVLGGSDSKVRIEFDPEGTIIDISYNWRALERAASIRTVVGQELKQRAEVLRRTRTVEPVSQSIECGYVAVDRGATGSSLEPACVAEYEVVTSGQRQRFADVLPLAQAAAPEASWPETLILDAESR